MLLELGRGAKSPGTHAFIVGVSNYPYADGPKASQEGSELGIVNLTAAARSASEVAAWLLHEYRNPDTPLRSITLFLSPAADESIHPSVAAEMSRKTAPATRTAVEEGLFAFREKCREHEDNIAFIYIAGHGVQLNKRGAVVLLEDVGEPGKNRLHGAIDVAGCRDAMDEAGNAKRQIWFSDACRLRPEIARQYENFGGSLTLDEGIGQVEASPLFLAASTRESAYANVGGTTIFAQALLWSLRGGSADHPEDDGCPDWHINTSRLTKDLPIAVRKLLRGSEAESNVDVTGRVLNVVAQRFAEPPEVDLEVALAPEDATPIPIAHLTNLSTYEDHPVPPGWPIIFRGRPAIYTLSVTVAPPLSEPNPIYFQLVPPVTRAVMKVS